MDASGAAHTLTMRPAGGAVTGATKEPSRDEEVVFRHGDITLAAFTSLEQMRWAWQHILAFSPLPALGRVKVPVLGVWGEADPLTDAPRAASAMREALLKGGNRDVTVKIFPHAGHSLMETSRKGMAPEVFGYLRQWLAARVRLSPAAVRNPMASPQRSRRR